MGNQFILPNPPDLIQDERQGGAEGCVPRSVEVGIPLRICLVPSSTQPSITEPAWFPSHVRAIHPWEGWGDVN